MRSAMAGMHDQFKEIMHSCRYPWWTEGCKKVKGWGKVG